MTSSTDRMLRLDASSLGANALYRLRHGIGTGAAKYLVTAFLNCPPSVVM